MSLAKIKYYGFDMDYTLAIYKVCMQPLPCVSGRMMIKGNVCAGAFVFQVEVPPRSPKRVLITAGLAGTIQPLDGKL